MDTDHTEPTRKSNDLDTLTPSPASDSGLWASHNLGGSGPYQYQTPYRQALRLSFDKPVVETYSHLRVFIVVPDHGLGYSKIHPIHIRHPRIRFQSRWTFENAQEEPTLTLVLRFRYQSPTVIDLCIQPIPMGHRRVFELYSGPLLTFSGTSTHLIPFEVWNMQPRFQPSHRYVYVHIATIAQSTRAGFPSLDPQVIRRITELCILEGFSDDYMESQRRIFRLSLISRQWHAVSHDFYDLLFSELVRTDRWLSSNGILAVTKLLLLKPSRGIGLTSIPLCHFRAKHPDVDGGKARNRWVSNICNFYANLPHVTTIAIINPLFYIARNELERLTKVTYLRLDAPKGGDFGYWGPDQTLQYPYKGEKDCIIGDVLPVVNGWNNLNMLFLTGDNTYKTSEGVEIPDEDASYRLSRLSLSQLRVTCKQIHHLVCRPETEQRLTNLNLDKLKGLSVRDYRTVLHSAALTLEHLTIGRCEMEADGEQELDGELPLDSTIALIHKIRTITVQSEVASNLSIARKVNPADQSLSKTRLTINAYDRTDLDAGTDRVGIGIVESIRHSGWDYVAISFRPTTEKMDKETRMQKRPYLVNAREVASSRGLEFRTL